MMKNRMIKNTVVDDDSYVYNVQVKVITTIVKRPNGRYRTNWINWYQVRKLDMVDSEDDKVYGLYAMCEFRKDGYLQLYMGELVHYDAKAKEEYLCYRLKVDRYKVCMGMNFINDSMFHAYTIKYDDNETRMRVMGALKKKCNKKMNVKIMKDYLVIATKRIVSGDDIMTIYDWHLEE